MSQAPINLKGYLKHMTGFRFKPGKLLDSYGDSVLVATRLLLIHPSRNPYPILDEQTVHDKLLELMQICHAERELMLGSTRMEPLLWQRVRSSISWARHLPIRIIRMLALVLTQASYANYQDPQCNSSGTPLPYCKLAIAALRFACDIFVYEDGYWPDGSLYRSDFAEFRGPAHLDNGDPCIDRDGNPVTIPVFPIDSFGAHLDLHSRNPSSLFIETEEEPIPMHANWLRRV